LLTASTSFAALKLWDQTEYVDDDVLPPGVEKRALAV